MFDPKSGLKALKERVLRCKACTLADTRTQAVFGVGRLPVEIMLVGEAPGEEEDKKGEPFIGRSGELLDTLFERSGIDRRKVWITNTAKCRPTDPLGNNRPPTKSEIQCCKPYLLEEIYLVDPTIIVLAGLVPTKTLTTFRTLRDASRDTYEIEVPGRATPIRYPVVSIQHPASLLRRAHNFDLIQYTVDQLVHVRKTLQIFRNLGRNVPFVTGVAQEGEKIDGERQDERQQPGREDLPSPGGEAQGPA